LIKAPSGIQDAAMPTTLSIKNVAETIAARLRQRAVKNHRSLQGERLAIIEAATLTPKYTALEILENPQ
jgi:plasmid stability protein